MLPKQNAIIAGCTIVMLLLVGLYVLGLSNAFARSSSLASSQSQNQATYRHPIVAYDKLTALGAKQMMRGDYPLEHYQQNSINAPIANNGQQQFSQIGVGQDDFDLQLMPPPPQVHSHHVSPHIGPPHHPIAVGMMSASPRHMFGPAPPPQMKQQQQMDKKQPMGAPPLLPPPPPTPPPQQQAPQSQSQTQAQSSPQLSSVPVTASASTINTTAPLLFQQDDSDYPMKEIMRAIESFAIDKPLEQLFPQTLVQLHLTSAAFDNNSNNNNINRVSQAPTFRQLLLDSLQPSVSLLQRHSQQVSTPPPLTDFFPSASYESLCRSAAYIASPRRAKSLAGQWKTIVNLPGHKYRGVAISQMVRVEECSSPNTECTISPPLASVVQFPTAVNAQNTINQQHQSAQLSFLPKSRCLQHYGNQQLVAWSPQLGFHVDIFRFPTACSCHMKR